MPKSSSTPPPLMHQVIQVILTLSSEDLRKIGLLLLVLRAFSDQKLKKLWLESWTKQNETLSLKLPKGWHELVEISMTLPQDWDKPTS